MIPDINIGTLGIQEGWNYALVMKDTGEIELPVFNQIKNGINIKFDIRTYIKLIEGKNCQITIDERNGHAWIYGQHYPLSELEDEIDERMTKIRVAILNNQDGIYKSEN